MEYISTKNGRCKNTRRNHYKLKCKNTNQIAYSAYNQSLPSSNQYEIPKYFAKHAS